MDEYNNSTGTFCIRASRGGCGGVGTGTKCGRWNPTSEQVKVLTELFRSGLRTPTTEQIQKISSQLSFYGKIESKNVFYWFQNHKARERQKRRRVVNNYSAVDEPINTDMNNNSITHHHQTHHLKLVSSSTKTNFVEINQLSDHPERVIETLQLFPLNSFNESTNTEKLIMRPLIRDEYYCKENNSSFTYNFGTGMDHPTLDLRLSFI